jgi:hypothetical protein
MEPNPSQSEGSHVHWPIGYDEADDDGESGENLHRMKGLRPGASSSWSPRFPNDRFVNDFAVTLEEMREAGAVD